MTSPGLQRWVNKASKRTARYRSIYSLIFGTGGFAYFIYRTRLQFMNLIARMVLHALEYFLVYHTMPSFLLPLIILRVSMIAIESGWWGMMDRMRQYVRSLHEKRDAAAIREEIEDWLAIAQRMTLVIFLAGFAGAILLSNDASQMMLMLVLAFSLGVRLIIRTLYSGIYALRRIYVRFDWIVAAEFSVFAIAWILKPWLGEWTLPLCLMATGIISSFISFYFIRDALGFMNITPRRLLVPVNLSRMRQRHKLNQLWMPGLAMISMRIHDVILIVTLQYFTGHGAQTAGLLFAFYLIMPAIRTAMGWSQILYFDMVRHHLDIFRYFRDYFERFGVLYAVFYGAVIALAAGGLLFFSMPDALNYYLLIALYIVFSAVLGVIQIGLFARERYVPLIGLTLLQYGLLALLVAYSFSLIFAFVFSLIIPVLLGMLILQLSGGRAEYIERRYLSWVSAVLAIKCSRMLLVIRLSDAQSKKTRVSLREQFGTILGQDILSCFYKNFYLAIVDKPSLTSEKLDNLRVAAVGHISHLYSYAVSDGKEAMQILHDKHAFPSALNKRSVNEVLSNFYNTFPTGLVQIPTQKNGQLLKVLQDEQMYLVSRNVLEFSEGRGEYSDTRWFVSFLQHKGLIEMIFLVDKSDVTEEKRAAWLRYVSGHSDNGAVAG
ncbi:MAG: hypothetical protein ACN2B6_05965 [Rickettsiales bacterium]